MINTLKHYTRNEADKEGDQTEQKQMRIDTTSLQSLAQMMLYARREVMKITKINREYLCSVPACVFP